MDSPLDASSDIYDRYDANAFCTGMAFSGNPVAVFLQTPDLPVKDLLRIARQINFAETIFVGPPINGGDASIRTFTRTGEIPFAGHPTLGTAAVLAAIDPILRTEFDDGQRTKMVLETGQGPIELTLDREEREGWMRQPISEFRQWNSQNNEAVYAALGISRDAIVVEPAMFFNGVEHLHMIVDDADKVLNLAPDIDQLQRLFPAPRYTETGVNCLARTDSGNFAVVTIFPHDPVPEDSACGTSAGVTAAFLAINGITESGELVLIEQGGRLGMPSLLAAKAFLDQDRVVQGVQVGGKYDVHSKVEMDLSQILTEAGQRGSGDDSARPLAKPAQPTKLQSLMTVD